MKYTGHCKQIQNIIKEDVLSMSFFSDKITIIYAKGTLTTIKSHA